MNIKGVRNIMHIDAAYMSKITNKEVIRRANITLYGEDCKRYLSVSERLRYRATTTIASVD